MLTKTKEKVSKISTASVSEAAKTNVLQTVRSFLELITFMIDTPVQTAADVKSRLKTEAHHKHNFLFTINIEMGEIYYGTEKS